MNKKIILKIVQHRNMIKDLVPQDIQSNGEFKVSDTTIYNEDTIIMYKTIDQLRNNPKEIRGMDFHEVHSIEKLTREQLFHRLITEWGF